MHTKKQIVNETQKRKEKKKKNLDDEECKRKKIREIKQLETRIKKGKIIKKEKIKRK